MKCLMCIFGSRVCLGELNDMPKDSESARGRAGTQKSDLLDSELSVVSMTSHCLLHCS